MEVKEAATLLSSPTLISAFERPPPSMALATVQKQQSNREGGYRDLAFVFGGGGDGGGVGDSINARAMKATAWNEWKPSLSSGGRWQQRQVLWW
jgi:hypothetical protein